MKKLKALWSQEEFDKLTPAQKEVMASKLILFFGLLLTLGGLLFLWKIGFFDFYDFWGIDREKMPYRKMKNCTEYSLLICSPVIAGVWLIILALTRLCRKKKNSSPKR